MSEIHRTNQRAIYPLSLDGRGLRLAVRPPRPATRGRTRWTHHALRDHHRGRAHRTLLGRPAPRRGRVAGIRHSPRHPPQGRSKLRSRSPSFAPIRPGRSTCATRRSSGTVPPTGSGTTRSRLAAMPSPMTGSRGESRTWDSGNSMAAPRTTSCGAKIWRRNRTMWAPGASSSIPPHRPGNAISHSTTATSTPPSSRSFVGVTRKTRARERNWQSSVERVPLHRPGPLRPTESTGRLTICPWSSMVATPRTSPTTMRPSASTSGIFGPTCSAVVPSGGRRPTTSGTSPSPTPSSGPTPERAPPMFGTQTAARATLERPTTTSCSAVDGGSPKTGGRYTSLQAPTASSGASRPNRRSSLRETTASGTPVVLLSVPGMVELPGDRVGVPMIGYAVPHKYPRRKPLGDIAWATWQKGRLVALAADEHGSFRTPDLLFKGNTMRANVRTKHVGNLLVEVVGDDGNPVSGHTFDDCDPIRGDYLSHSVTWRGDPAIRREGHRPVSFRV